ncbi:hypothetical protein D2962_15675 [Biomaibacter acetigenes]|uniref:Acetolactate synthase large subunit n=1 Tax=Biomaibacter acetigenes TaxID=2316383 RepID=A0A3G2R8R3_9FIRM|nr:thiamine pyrophosphate-dependent enzyme [Biomaibacter acetigenes]AYO31851.1 hypothetical protein D2962_15675 [Biomaibacter acetigenes]
MKVSDVVAKILKEEGVTYVFGYPGGEVTTFLDSLRQENIRFILTKHESTAAFMASAIGEITGMPGVCLSTLGPGATNLVTGVAQALLDRAPVIAITGNMATNNYEVSTHQQLDLVRLFQPITKWSATIEPNSVERILYRAISFAKASRKGPVHLTFPSNVAVMEKQDTNFRQKTKCCGSSFIGDIGDINEATKVINEARRPIILAGLGVLRSGSHKEFVKFTEKLNSPVIVTPKAKGIIREDHPLFLGVVEMQGDRVILDFAKSCDLIVAIGYDAVELDKQWMFGNIPVINIDEVPDTDKYYPVSVEIYGEMKGILDSLARDIERSKWDKNEIMSKRNELIELVTTRRSEAMQPYEVVMKAREILPEDTIAASDVGAHKMLVGQMWRTYEPGTFFMSNGLSSMGSGIPTAMAAKLVYPEKPVVAIVGDGGFGMNMAELETMVRENIPIIIIVMDDRILSLIRMNQERKGLVPYGVEFTNPDMVKLAESFGAKGYKVDNIKDFTHVLKSVVQTNKPVVIQAVVDPLSYRNL